MSCNDDGSSNFACKGADFYIYESNFEIQASCDWGLQNADFYLYDSSHTNLLSK